jgi:hypothetical protein
MPTIYAANESSVLLDGKPIEGVRGIEYVRQQDFESVYAMGSPERIGVAAGRSLVSGKLRVASTAPALDKLESTKQFQLSAQLVHGKAKLTVTFDECQMDGRSLQLDVAGTAESVYTFTATRVREEPAS